MNSRKLCLNYELKPQRARIFWPTPQDYNESIQNPSVNLSDGDLRNGTVRSAGSGIPMPVTGGFASVYRIDTGEKRWALRCFLRQIPDIERRYQHTLSFLQKVDLPYMAASEFSPKGIRVGDSWYPTLKMEWISGLTLDEHVRRLAASGQPVPRRLCDEFLTICLHMQTLGISHGDLQHGNIIVGDDRLRLVDYDGMRVPSMRSAAVHELGHRHYQHPLRNNQTRHSVLDNFSAWSIYISLQALSLDPQLLQGSGRGDDCLLFRESDYLNPLRSSAFAALESHPSDELRQLSRFLRWLLILPPNMTPPLNSRVFVPMKLPAVNPSF